MDINFLTDSGEDSLSQNQYLMVIFNEKDVIYQLKGEEYQVEQSDMYIALEAQLTGVRRIEYPY